MQNFIGRTKKSVKFRKEGRNKDMQVERKNYQRR